MNTSIIVWLSAILTLVVLVHSGISVIPSVVPCKVTGYFETMIRASGRCNNRVKNPHLAREPQRWQQVASRKVLVFSAFVERRPLAGGPSIRIIASGHQAYYNQIGHLYCQLWYEDDRLGRAYTTGPAHYEVIYLSTKWHQLWSSHFIICQLPSHMSHNVPLYVSVTPKPCSTKPTNALLILNRDPSVRKSSTSHAHCISTIYNRWNDAEMLTEMVEASKIIGHSEILVYVQLAGNRVLQVLRSYEDDPNSGVRVVRYPFPSHLTSKVRCQRGAINDCFYRLSQRHQYVTIGDMDELHVPRLDRTLARLIKRVGHPLSAAYHFQHKYFRRNYTHSTGYPPLITQSSLYTTEHVYPPGLYRCKSMYNTDLAVKLDIHYAYTIVPGSREQMLAPEDALLHHYRIHRMFNMTDEDTVEYRYQKDGYMRTYGDVLNRTVGKRLREAGVYNPPS